MSIDWWHLGQMANWEEIIWEGKARLLWRPASDHSGLWYLSSSLWRSFILRSLLCRLLSRSLSTPEPSWNKIDQKLASRLPISCRGDKKFHGYWKSSNTIVQHPNVKDSLNYQLNKAQKIILGGNVGHCFFSKERSYAQVSISPHPSPWWVGWAPAGSCPASSCLDAWSSWCWGCRTYCSSRYYTPSHQL